MEKMGWSWEDYLKTPHEILQAIRVKSLVDAKEKPKT